MPRQNGLFSSLKDSITSGLSAFANAARNKTMEPSRNLLAQRAQTIPTSVYRSEPTKAPTMMSSLPNAVRSVAEQALQKPVSEMLQTGRERFKELEKQGPTPTRPGVPVNARGAGMSFPSTVTQPEAQPQPMTPATAAPELMQSRFAAQQLQESAQPMLHLPSAQPLVPSITPEQYNQLNPQQQLQYRRAAQQQQLQQAREMSEAPFKEVDTRAQEREDALRSRISELQKGELTPAQREAFDVFKADLDAEETRSIARLEATAARRREQLNEALSFSGFGRSTKRAEQLDAINKDLQNNIADIERSSNRQLSDVKVQMLAQNEAKVAKLEDQLTRTQSQRDQYALQQALDYKDSVQTIMKQNPDNPQSVIAAADKLKSAQLEQQQKFREEAVDNFRWMTDKFGSSFVTQMNDDEVRNYARNLGVPASSLRGLGPTLKEVDRAWDQSKYLNDFEYRMTNDQVNRDQALLLKDLDYRSRLKMAGVNFEYDKKKLFLGEQIKNDAAARAYQGLYTDDYSFRAEGADGSSLYFPEGVTHSSSGDQVVAMNPKLINILPNGTKKMPQDGPNGLGGQCAWEARKWTDLTPVGNSIAEKKSHLNKWAKQGKALKKGEYTIHDLKPGQTILTNRSPEHGHVAVINAVTNDGRIVLSEFNAGGKLTYTNTRSIPFDDPAIIGIWQTKLKPQYQVAKSTEDLDKIKSTGDMYPEQKLVREGRLDKSELSDLMERLGGAARDPNNPYREQAQRKYDNFLEDYLVGSQRATQSGAGKPPSASQYLVAGYADRMEDAMEIFDDLEKKITSPWTTTQMFQRAAPSMFQRDEFQQQEQAEKNFINAVLRRESGAVISPEEFDMAAKQYFPQPGDGKAVLANKKKNRDRVLKNFKREAGHALEPSGATVINNLFGKYGIKLGSDDSSGGSPRSTVDILAGYGIK